MQRTIRIGTRDSELALWQAKKVQRMLRELAFQTEIIPTKIVLRESTALKIKI